MVNTCCPPPRKNGGRVSIKRDGDAWNRPQFENNYFTRMCSGSEAGSYLRLIDFVYHSTLGLRVMKNGGRVSIKRDGDARLDQEPTGSRTTTSQKCEAVPRRARIQGS